MDNEEILVNEARNTVVPVSISLTKGHFISFWKLLAFDFGYREKTTKGER